MTDNLQPQPQTTTPPIKSVCVFCGSGSGKDPAFAYEARALGRELANLKLGLVYGGGDMGLMGTLAESTMANGGRVTGIIPEFLLPYQNGSLSSMDQIVTTTMHERKARMYDLADAFIALPGGIGTLEELVETMTWLQLRQHQKPIILLDVEGFWQPLLELLAHMKSHHFIRPGLEVNFHIISSTNELPPLLQAAPGKAGEDAPQSP